MDPFDAFESKVEESDPAAEFLAREQEELAKIESNDFGSAGNDDFGSAFGASTEVVTDAFASAVQVEDTGKDLYSSIQNVDRLTQEPEKIKKWREEQKKRIETKDAEEEQKKKEWKESAKKELEDWYKNRHDQLIKTRENNKVANKTAEAELNAPYDSNAKNVEWDRIAKYCDFNPKGNKNTRDVGRLRSILLQLKQTPLVR